MSLTGIGKKAKWLISQFATFHASDFAESSTVFTLTEIQKVQQKQQICTLKYCYRTLFNGMEIKYQTVHVIISINVGK